MPKSQDGWGSIEMLFSTASRHAVAYRTTAPAHHHPEHAYAGALSAFDDELAEEGSDAVDVLEDMVRRVDGGLHATTGPRFFGWVIGGSHPVGVAADWLAAAWGQPAGSHIMAAAAAAETVALRWLLDLLKLPPQASVGFVTGATMANFTCLAAARGEVLRRAGWDLAERGLCGAPPVRILIGDDAHTTVFSALRYLGFGNADLVRVATDDQGAMRAQAFEQALPENGPVIVVTQAGQINTGAFDPHDRIVERARQRGAWVHVDGAFGLWARACPATAGLARGVELADSWATDGHKWLQTPYDCGYAIVRDAEAHRRAMTITASYLPPVSGSERDPSHYVPELSRRARGFATWALLRHLGRAGVSRMIERHCGQARLMAGLLAAEPGISIVNDVVLNQVLVRFGASEPDEAGDALTHAAIESVQADGTCFAAGARWRDRWVMRISVINAATTDDDIRMSAAAIARCWRRVRAEA